MSNHYDPTAGVSMGDMMDQGYPMYDNNFTLYPRLTGPPSHFDGVAFWYRPNNVDSVYERDPAVYARGTALSGNSMEVSGVKHRRTRSGCFTCRSRRVKCDETRPVCERCKKGGRECEFPQTSSSSKRNKHSESHSPQETAKHETPDTTSGLQTIKDESEEEGVPAKPARRPTISSVRTNSTQSVPRKHRSRSSQDASPTIKEKGSPLSSTTSGSHSRSQTPASSLHTSARSAEIQARQAKIKTLKPELQKYLQYQHDHMTHYHYFFKLDPADFVHNEFIDQALSFEPLLYAAVGFAAYHHELKQESPRLSTFLKYHSKALSLLRKSLEHQPKYTPAILLTILQLATFEEYLGDWVNLIGHHRAAHTMLLQLYQPDRMMESELGRRIFSWYARLDIISGLMGGGGTQLDRPWFEANSNWYHSAVDTDLDNDIDLEGIMADFVSANRLLGYDMASLYAKLQKKEISISDFQHENQKFRDRLAATREKLETLNDGFYAVQEFPAAETRPLTDEDIVNPYLPGGLFMGVLFPLNFLWIDWYAIEQMQVYQEAKLLQKAIPPKLEQLSLEQCRIYDAVERWPDAPENCILGAHASLGLATVFMKKDPKHIMWARRKFAQVEKLGYVFPPTFRAQMAHVWGLTKEDVGEEDCIEHWWMPRSEGLLPVLTEIRQVVLERHQLGEDQMIVGSKVEDIRDLKAIFAKLDIRSQSGTQSQSSSNPTSGTSGANSTALASPSSTTSTEQSDERRDSSQSIPSIATSRRKSKVQSGDTADRMSGIWS